MPYSCLINTNQQTLRGFADFLHQLLHMHTFGESVGTSIFRNPFSHHSLASLADTLGRRTNLTLVDPPLTGLCLISLPCLHTTCGFLI